MPSDDGQKALQTLSSGFDDFVRKPVRENLSRQWRDVDSGRLSFENIPKGFEIGIASTNDRMAKLESRDVGLAYDFVISVHLPAKSYRTGSESPSPCEFGQMRSREKGDDTYHASVGSSLQSPGSSLGRYTSPRSVTRQKKVENLFMSFVLRTGRVCIGRKLTVCSRPPGIRYSSNKLLRANGEGVVIEEGCRVPRMDQCHTAAGVTGRPRVTIPTQITKQTGGSGVPEEQGVMFSTRK